MFDFDDIEADVEKRGARTWAEDGKDGAELQREASERAAAVARAVAVAAQDQAARKKRPTQKAPGAPQAPPPLVIGEFGRDEHIGSLSAVVYRPRLAPGERAKPAVVICSGNPSAALGASHMCAPLIVALFDAVSKAGFPAVRFDYRGVGQNVGAGGQESRVPGPQESSADTILVTKWALEHLSDRVVIAGYSYGTSMALVVLMAGLASAFIALSCGTEQWRMFEGDPEESERRKEDKARHSRVNVPAIYLCGEKDWITDQGELHRLLAARVDGGRGAKVEVLPGVKHELLGQEGAAAARAASWLLEWHSCGRAAPARGS